MLKTKSPFLIIQDFISPLLCEQIVDGMDFLEPDTDKDQNPQLTIKHDDKFQEILFNYVQAIIPQIESHYNVGYRGMKPVDFKWYPDECPAEQFFTCENATYTKNKKWVKTKDRDLTCVLFLSTHNDKIPFESDYEVYGGKLEFPQHQFGFSAERGTLVIYPSEPHFLNQVQAVLAGDLFIAKFHIATALPFLYDPRNFPGDYTTWFETIV